jgi:uncharacterized protein YjdB
MQKRLLIVTLLLCLLVSCKKDIDVTGVTVSKALVEMEVGQSYQLGAQVQPADATDPTVFWITDNPSVATVTDDGLVTAVGAGEAEITAGAGLITSSCTVKVKEKTIPVTSVTLDCATLTLLEGESAKLTATVKPDDATERRVTWSSSDESVATVDTHGKVLAGQEGVCAIVATNGDKYAACAVSVSKKIIRVESIEISRSSLNLMVGESETLTASVLPQTATDQSYAWASTNPDIADVDQNGKITAKTAGTAIVAVTSNDGSKTAICSVKVSELTPPEGDWADLGLPSGLKWATRNLGAVNPEDYGDYYAWGEVETKNNFGWQTYYWSNGSYNKLTKYNIDVSVGTVDNTTILLPQDDIVGIRLGDAWRMPTEAEFEELQSNCTWTWTTRGGVKGALVESKTNGNSIFLPAAGYIKASESYNAGAQGCYWTSSLYTVNSCNAWKVVFSPTEVLTGYGYRCFGLSLRPVSDQDVRVPVEGISLDAGNMTMNVGSSATLAAAVSPNSATQQLIIWSSSDSQVATVSHTGVVKANKAGTAIITATSYDGGKSASCRVIVKAADVPVTGVILDRTALNMVYGTGETLTATVTPLNASERTVTWTSDNTSVARVDSNGKVIATGVGSATVTASAGGKSARCTVVVTPIPVSGITLPDANIVVGATVTLTASVTPASAENREVTWSSSNPGVATVSNTGVVTGLASGTATISATAKDGSGVSGSCIVTVREIDVASVVLDKTSLSLEEGETALLVASVEPDSATDKSVTWSSSDDSVVSMDAAGKVTAVSAGTATVTVTTNNGNRTAICSVKVWTKHEWVDLGLPSHLKWATYNIGAATPEEFGNYYSWGELTPKNRYEWGTYIWCTGNYLHLTKYNQQGSYGIVDNRKALELDDDAARVNWGGSWRMPTRAEFNELLVYCTRTWTTQNGVEGELFTSKSNGKSIFFPAGGYSEGTLVNNKKSEGYYWSTTLYTNAPSFAYNLCFNSSSTDTSFDRRYWGMAVRAVKE